MSEENKKIFQKENSSKGKHEIVFPDEKLEDEGKVLTVYEEEIPIDRGNKCNELNTSVILNTQKIESTINSCVMSTDIPNIIRDNNRMQVNNLLTQKQGKYKCILVLLNKNFFMRKIFIPVYNMYGIVYNL